MHGTCNQEAADAATEILANSAVTELRYLRVDEKEDQLLLSGRVNSFYHKQLAQEAVLPVAGGRRVVNQVDVSRP
ncbi:MAG: BON domain-containing protein [Planctomycetota bacterium]